MANPTPPNITDRHSSLWWDAPIGVGTVETQPLYAGDLPTSDPHVVGQLWADSTAAFVIKVSQG